MSADADLHIIVFSECKTELSCHKTLQFVSMIENPEMYLLSCIVVDTKHTINHLTI